MLYADSPIDTGLFSLYLHQNYVQFCDTIEECEGISDWYSWIDSSGGERVRIASLGYRFGPILTFCSSSGIKQILISFTLSLSALFIHCPRLYLGVDRKCISQSTSPP